MALPDSGPVRGVPPVRIRLWQFITQGRNQCDRAQAWFTTALRIINTLHVRRYCSLSRSYSIYILSSPSACIKNNFFRCFPRPYVYLEKLFTGRILSRPCVLIRSATNPLSLCNVTRRQLAVAVSLSLKSPAIAGRTARCRYEFWYVSNFYNRIVRFLCHSTPFLYRPSDNCLSASLLTQHVWLLGVRLCRPDSLELAAWWT